MIITSVFSSIHGVKSKMNGSTVILTKQLIMYSEECQIQTFSSKNGKISEKTSSSDVKSIRRV